MKDYLLLLLIFLSFSFIFRQSVYSQQDYIEVSDTIWSDVTWSADTVKVVGNVHVPDDIILTIEPGTCVEFQGPYQLYILGTIIADGAPGDSILLNAPNEIKIYPPGNAYPLTCSVDNIAKKYSSS